MSSALRLSGVGLVRDDVTILDGVDWEVAPHERWIVLGPNGSGKTTLMRVAGLYLHPSRGEVEVLGERLGRVDVRRLRTRIGFVSAAFAAMLRDGVTAADVVMTAEHAALETWWHTYEDSDRSRALELLDRMGAGPLADRPFGAAVVGRTPTGPPGPVAVGRPRARAARRADRGPRPRCPRGPGEPPRWTGGGPDDARHRARHPPRRGDPRRLHATCCCWIGGGWPPPVPSTRCSAPNCCLRCSALPLALDRRHGRYAARAQ